MSLPKELYHYSEKIIEKLENRELYAGIDREWYGDISQKPVGFWLSVEDYEDDQNWKTWCEAEDFNLECLAYRYKIFLKDSAKILLLTSYDEIIEFTMKYKAEVSLKSNQFLYPEEKPFVYQINWLAVKKLYDGIIIAPYVWGCRLDTCSCWYYGWDCASGCIWNVDVIESFKLVECQAVENGKD